MSETVRKFAVLDTSVLVHDPSIASRLRGYVVCVPIYVVMELDTLKSGKERSAQVRVNARDASNFIDELHQYGDVNSVEGATHPTYGITYRVIRNGHKRPIEVLDQAENGMVMDQHILRCAEHLKDHEKNSEVHLLSLDTNMRIFARSVGVRADVPLAFFSEDSHSSDIPRGYRRVCEENVSLSSFDLCEKSCEEIVEALGVGVLVPNEFLWVAGKEDKIWRCQDAKQRLREICSAPKNLGVIPRNAEQRMALELLLDKDVELVSLLGQAGTGKTLLALVAGLYQLAKGDRHPHERYERIVVARPMVSVGNEIGYLPGGIEGKVEPWMKPIQDNLEFLLGHDALQPKEKGKRAKTWQSYVESGQIELQAISLIRGRTLRDAFIIVDEAQNLTPLEVKTILTRVGEGAKVVLTGDPAQIDHKYLDRESNGLVHAATRLYGETMVGMVALRKGERSSLASLAAEKLS